MKTLLVLLLAAAPSYAACPQGMKAVGDDSERGYKCVPRDGEAPRPALKPSKFKAGNSVSAAGTYGAPDEKEEARRAEAEEEAPAPPPMKAPKTKGKSRGDAAPVAEGCPKGWKKKGEGCAPPSAK